MKNKIVILLSIVACLLYALSAHASVMKSEIVREVQVSIETNLNKQIAISSRYKDGDKPKFKFKIHEYAIEWGAITQLIPEENINEQAAEWIKESIAQTALGAGLYFLDVTASNNGTKQNAEIDQKIARDILPTLTNAKMSEFMKKRDKLLANGHTFQQKWRSLIISTLRSANLIQINTDPFSFGSYVEAILHDTRIQKRVNTHNGVVDMSKAWEPSFVMTAALIYRIDQRLAVGNFSYESGIKNLISPVYSKEYADKINYKTFDEVSDKLKQELDQIITKDGKITKVDTYGLYKLVWGGIQLQYGSLGNSQVSSTGTKGTYVIFDNAKTMWDKFSTSNPVQ